MNMLHQFNFLPHLVFLAILLALPYGYVFAENGANDAGDKTTTAVPENRADNQSDKKCLTVCQNWGEDCMINPRTGSRKCRRVCKEFGEECFDPNMPQLSP